MLSINQGLECIYINVSNHPIEVEEFKAFTEYMQEEGIEVRKGLPEITASHVEDEEIVFCDDNAGILVITDSDESVSELDVAVVGYGAGYQGTASYVIESLDVWVSYLRMAYARYMELPFVVAETDRLIIREMTLDDLSQMYELYESI
ncbi:MAG: hypothetical protein IJB96_09550, partial [Lachnospira sp.]|nr:hypothetical protein [Lachnospira sp.]